MHAHRASERASGMPPVIVRRRPGYIRGDGERERADMTPQPRMPPVPVPSDPRVALRDAVRLAALDATDLRSPERIAALRPVVRVAARALHVPVAQLNVLTEDQQVPLVAWAPHDHDPARWDVAVGLDASFCQHVVALGAPLRIEDAREHALVRDSTATTDAGIVAYAGVPVRAPAVLGSDAANRVLGTVCVVDFAPRTWSEDDVAILEDLAATVTAELGLRATAASEAALGVAAIATNALGQADAALAESELRFRALADSMPQLAWIADETGAIAWYNRRWFEYTGTILDDMVGWGWRSVHHPEHVDAVVAAFREAIDARRPWEDTFPLRRHDGEWRWFLSQARPVHDPGTGRIRWFGTNTDITERIAIETERARLLSAEQDARRAAEQANLAKSQFLATMSHELRTPLNAIGGYADLLDMGLRGPVTEAQRADIARIRHGQRHLLSLINEILNFARLESGTVDYRIETVPAAAALRDVSTMIVPLAAARGLSFRVAQCAPTLAVHADREKLRQVLANLLSNAVKFTMPPGAIRLSCATDDADWLRFTVHDTGIGIASDRLDAIFEPFVQVDTQLTRTAGGTGLGLSISRELARGMGGELSVTSVPGEGSAFTLRLPRAPDLDEPVHATPAAALGLVEAEAEVRRLLDEGGVHAALRFLNARTFHRFTGLYRFDGTVLRNVALFDREAPALARGEDAPMHETWCAIVGTTERTFTLADARADARVVDHPARETVVSYCGALVRGGDGRTLGTLCSFDVEPRPVPELEVPLLETVAPIFARYVLDDTTPDVRPDRTHRTPH